jgi:hypothetical protein
LLHATACAGLKPDAGFETAAAAGCSACTDFGTSFGADAKTAGKARLEAGLVTRTGAASANLRNKSASVSDLSRRSAGLSATL